MEMKRHTFLKYRAVLEYTFLFFWLLQGPLVAQDQIKREGSDPLLGKKSIDTTKINSLLKQFDSYRASNPDSAILISQKTIELSDDVGYEEGKALGFKNIGIVYFDQGDYQKALDFYKRSLNVYLKEADTNGISNLQSNIGSVYKTVGDIPRALEYFINSLRNARIVRDTLRMGTALMNLGTVYTDDESTHDKAIESYEMAIEMFNAIGYTLGQGGTQLNFGLWYIDKGEPLKAIPYLRDARENFEKVGFYEAYALNALGQAYFDLGELRLSEEYYTQALKASEEKQNLGEEERTYLGLGKIYYEMDNYPVAIDYFKKALEVSENTGVLEDQGEAYLNLSEIYSVLGDYRNAYDSQKKFTQIQDNLKAENYEEKMSQLNVQFDLENAERENELLKAQNELNELQIERDARAKQLLLIILGLFLAIIAGFIFQYFYIRRTNKRLAFERNRSDQILLNILPRETAEELKENGFVKAQEFDRITVLFTDFKAFSLVAERISADKLVKSVDYYFKNFDEITERHNLEKIKTIGDAYMCAGGIPTPNNTHVRDAYGAAVEILRFVKETEMHPPEGIYPFKIRIGLNTGPVVAGVVGTKKFAYDIWGNTVNIAARMESGSITGRINVSETVYQELKEEHEFTYRGELTVKGQVFKMYFAEVPETIPA